MLGDRLALRSDLAAAQQGSGFPGAQRQNRLMHHHKADGGGKPDRLGQPGLAGPRCIGPFRSLPGQDDGSAGRRRTGRPGITQSWAPDAESSVSSG